MSKTQNNIKRPTPSEIEESFLAWWREQSEKLKNTPGITAHATKWAAANKWRNKKDHENGR